MDVFNESRAVSTVDGNLGIDLIHTGVNLFGKGA